MDICGVLDYAFNRWRLVTFEHEVALFRGSSGLRDVA